MIIILVIVVLIIFMKYFTGNTNAMIKNLHIESDKIYKQYCINFGTRYQKYSIVVDDSTYYEENVIHLNVNKSPFGIPWTYNRDTLMSAILHEISHMIDPSAKHGSKFITIYSRLKSLAIGMKLFDPTNEDISYSAE